MRIFVTGSTGFIGTAVVRELLNAGHSVLGLTRSDEGVAALAIAGAEALRGTVEDLDLLAQGAAGSDAVIHLAFNHDFSRYLQNCEDDRRVIAALGSALAGSDRALLITSGTAMVASPEPGAPSVEDGERMDSSIAPRAASEEAGLAAASAGANVSIVRLPQVHDPRRQGLITPAIAIAQEKGRFAYVGDGANRWPAAPVADVARLYRLAVERAERGAVYHAVAEEGVPMRAIAETIGARLGLPAVSVTPEEAAEHYGWLAAFATLDMPASSAITRRLLGWEPAGPGLIADLERLEI